MALEIVFRTSDAYEAAQVLELLKAAGLHAVVQGEGQSSLWGNGQFMIEQQLLVPSQEVEQARAFLEARPTLDRTEPTGASLGDAVCAVHEKQAVATCERCGNFLCADCGSLGTPPICESCVQVAEPARARPRWAMTIARLYVGSYAVSLLVALLITLGAIWWSYFR
jgi:hypothetical protein